MYHKALVNFFFPPENEMPPDTFREYMDIRAHTMTPFLGTGLALLPLFNIPEDRLLVPEAPELFYIRLAFILTGALSLIAYFIPYFKRRGGLVMAFIMAVLFYGTALMVVVSGAHPAYMSAYIMVMILGLLSLIPPVPHYLMTTGSLIFMLVLLVIYDNLRISDPLFRYQLYDLLLGWGVSSIVYLLTYRRRHFKYLRFARMNNKKELVERHSERITHSLRYAERIQSAILGDTHTIFQFFRDGFILNRPRDLVGGDFYWSWNCREMATGIADSVRERFSQLVVVGDCTGHGVPAGFMTVLMVNFLDTIVKREGILSPNELLHHLDERMLRVFKEESNPVIHGGADLTAVLFSYDYKNMWYAGAKNPVLLGRDGEIERLTVSRFSVGSYYKKELKEFILYEKRLKVNDQLYLMSDGYQDQYSPSRKKKLSRQIMQQTLEANLDQPMDIQQKKLEETLDQWQGDEEQTDDIFVMGLRL